MIVAEWVSSLIGWFGGAAVLSLCAFFFSAYNMWRARKSEERQEELLAKILEAVK